MCYVKRISYLVAGLLVLQSIPNGSARPITSKSGKVIEAEIKSVDGEDVTIVRDRDSKEFTIPIATLSDEDQEMIKARVIERMPKPAEEVKPGARFTIEFPELGSDRRGNPAQMGVSIPASYKPTEPVPLFIWMGGGDGGNKASTAGVVNGDRFITAGMPYPKDANNPHQSNMVGNFPGIWNDYHEPMLKELFEKIPNIDKRLCILGGFSNGAHCIAGVLRDTPDGGYPEYFNCFILVDGGNGSKRLRGGKGNYLFATWGETSPNASRTEEAGKKASGLQVELFEMPKTGHTFSPLGKEKVKAWLKETVIPATLGPDPVGPDPD